MLCIMHIINTLYMTWKATNGPRGKMGKWKLLHLRCKSDISVQQAKKAGGYTGKVQNRREATPWR